MAALPKKKCGRRMLTRKQEMGRPSLLVAALRYWETKPKNRVDTPLHP
jgi:hypothetical protein